MNLEKLVAILKQNKLYIKETSKNVIVRCPVCNDHPNPKKWGHMYVSKDPSIPTAHCFYCNCGLTISNLIRKLTGSSATANEVISADEEKKAQTSQSKIRKFKERTRQLKVPAIGFESFLNKRLYIKRRTLNKIEITDIPNLVFDFGEFFRINGLNLVGAGDDKILSNQEFDLLSTYFVGFLSHNHTTLYCRCIEPTVWFQFKKISLQPDSLSLLDYWSIPGGNIDSGTVVLSEGNFDILGEYVSDSLKLKGNVLCYASGNSFSYSSLLKSVCFNENLYKCNVTILSDNDKKPEWYRKFKKENSHIIKKLEIWGNKTGKDFGVFPVVPYVYKDTNF